MTRPLNWQPLASADPTPGDAATVEQGADHYRDISRAISNARVALKDLMSAGDYQSNAADALRARAEEVHAELQAVGKRYDSAALTLDAYASELRGAQSIADTALDEAKSYEAARLEAIADEATWRRRAFNARKIDDQAYAATCDQRAASEHYTATRMANAIANLRDDELQRAIRKRDNAAEQASRELDSTMDDGLNDGWWDNWGAKVVGIISTVANIVATVAGVLALVLCWVPVLGQVLAAVALIATAVALVADVILAATGEKDWGDAAWDLLALATFGVGRVATSAFRVAALTRGVQSATRAAEMTAQVSRSVTTTTTMVVSSAEGIVVTATRVTETAARLEAPLAASFRDVFAARGGWSRLLADALSPRTISASLAEDLGGLRLIGSADDVGRVFSEGWQAISTGPLTTRLTNVFVGSGEANLLASSNAERATTSGVLSIFGVSPQFASAVLGSSPTAALGGGVGLAALADASLTSKDVFENATDIADPGFDFTSWITGQSEMRSAADRLNL